MYAHTRSHTHTQTCDIDERQRETPPGAEWRDQHREIREIREIGEKREKNREKREKRDEQGGRCIAATYIFATFLYAYTDVHTLVWWRRLLQVDAWQLMFDRVDV